MKIEHAALWVKDLEAVKTFYQTWFGARPGPLYQNEKTGFSSYFLSFPDGESRLEIMNMNGDFGDNSVRWGWAHLAFSTGSREEVDGLTASLKEAGFEVLSGPRITGDGYYESCILDPEGNRIEITE